MRNVSAAYIIPAASFLLELSAALQNTDLALNFISKRAPDPADRVHVFDLDLYSKLRLRLGSHRDVAVAAELTFFHVGIAHPAVDQDLFKRSQKRERFLGRIDLGLGHDLHQRRAGAVEIDSRARFEMETLRHIFLEMNAHQMHLLVWRRDIFLRVLRISEIVQRHTAIGAKRHVVLRNLIILRHVRIEIILPVELADRRDVASEHEAGEHRHAQRFVIHHRQGAGQPEANRTSVRVRFGAKFNRTRAKHFRARLELNVDFKADGGDVLHCTYFWIA